MFHVWKSNLFIVTLKYNRILLSHAWWEYPLPHPRSSFSLLYLLPLSHSLSFSADAHLTSWFTEKSYCRGTPSFPAANLFISSALFYWSRGIVLSNWFLYVLDSIHLAFSSISLPRSCLLFPTSSVSSSFHRPSFPLYWNNSISTQMFSTISIFKSLP